MALSAREREGVAAILGLMPSDEEVVGLAETVSARLIPVSSRHEATRIICACSQQPIDVLKRQKVKKKYLSRYLLQVGETVDPRNDKAAMVKAILKYWNSSEVDVSMELEVSMDEGNVTGDAVQTATHTVVEMGVQFATWFYSLLNGLSSTLPRTLHGSPDCFGTVHFWNDCRLKLVCQDSQSNTRDVECHSNGDVVRCLGELVVGERLAFSPNLTADGVKASSEAHGLVKVFVCGVLHRNNDCVGTFEQLFGLVQDVSGASHWKVKFTNMALHYNFPITS